MENDSLQKYLAIFQKNALPLFLGIAGLIFFGYGLMQFLPHKKDNPDILFEGASDVRKDVAVASKSAEKQIVVDVEGAVMKPGVYHLPQDGRVQDALIAAGGLAGNADHGQVAKSVNLASKLTDGIKLYIPMQGEQVAASGGQTVLGSETTGLININTASATDLDSLPGIGPVTAEKIISNRPYAAIEELVDKKAVNKSVFEKIKDKINL